MEVGQVRDRLMQERKRSRALTSAMGWDAWPVAKAELQDMIDATRAEKKMIAAKTDMANVKLGSNTAT
eukprot:scaffold650041_cov46-Prasinocladus_malaysianus.AAC.1